MSTVVETAAPSVMLTLQPLSASVSFRDQAYQALKQAVTKVSAQYLHPYQMHGSMGSSCAVADVQGDKATIYSPTQGVWYQKTASAMITGLKPENVHVIFRRGSGCYGLNGADTVTYDAVVLSQAVGKPVRVQWTRADETGRPTGDPSRFWIQRLATSSRCGTSSCRRPGRRPVRQGGRSSG